MVDRLAEDKQLPLEGIAGGAVRVPGQEQLADDRLAGLDALAETGIIRGHVPPAQQGLALGQRIQIPADLLLCLNYEHCITFISYAFY